MIYSVFNSNLLLFWGSNFTINKASLILRLPAQRYECFYFNGKNIMIIFAYN